jgi:hypothetical protein
VSVSLSGEHVADSESPERVDPKGELTSAGFALALVVVMFALKWYGVVGIAHGADRTGRSSAEDAWHSLTGLRWLMLVAAAVAIGSAVLHRSQRSHGVQTNTGLVVAVIGAVTAALLADRVLIDPPSRAAVVDAKLGAVLGLICAIGIAQGGYESTREEMAQTDRVRKARAAENPLPSRSIAR